MNTIIWLFLFIPPVGSDGVTAAGRMAETQTREACSALVDIHQAIAEKIGLEGDYYCLPVIKVNP